MFNLPTYPLQSEEESTKTAYAPLFCWDIANPALARRILIHEDLFALNKLIELYNWSLDLKIKQLLVDNYTMIVTNLNQEITWVSNGFESMTGYTSKEVAGKRPSFLQGKKTNLKSKTLIREKLTNFENIEIKILNYRKDGEAYWCMVKIHPIRTKNNVVTHFIAIEKEVH